MADYEEAYVIRDDYDQTTKAVVVGVGNSNSALTVAHENLIESEGDLYVCAVVPLLRLG